MDFIFKTSNRLIVALSCEGRLRIFTLQRVLLKILGFEWWKEGLNFPLPDFMKKWGYQAFWVILMICDIVLTLKASVWMAIDNDLKYTIKMNGIIVMMPFVGSLIKIFYLRYMQKEFIELIETCESIGHLDMEEESIQSGLRLNFVYINMLLSTVGIWAIFFTIINHEIPVATDFPWSQDVALGQFFSLMIDFYCGINCCLAHSLLDTIFPVSAIVIIAHLATLRKKLAKLGCNKYQDEVLLNESIELHNKLLSMSELLQICYNEVSVAQSLYSVMHSCVLIFAVEQVPNKFSVLVSSFPLLLCSYAQLWMYCSFGQMMTDEFDKISFALYNNRWYACSISSRKALVTFAQACQKKVGLKGVGNINASYSNFLHKIQDSVSYYLILKTVTSESDGEKN
ncbi:odorant receptor 85b-like [Cimex lectularius]|uniref:Odorant receptor n=1 Tax=Cimex lectularius TaxID=79782 RepID=A0A8I6SQB6_CIMLE|nr:odorant receptor 85b-like [Cimex lectularius]